MDLVIDIGNTLMKAAIFEDRKISVSENFKLESIKKLTSFISKNYYSGAIISSVREIPDVVIQSLKSSSGKFIILDSNISVPVVIGYETPETLGPDRLALAVAGSERYPGKNVLIIDAGSCITYDYVNENKVYLGGAISPGIEMRFKALNQFTGKLPLIEKEDKISLTGRNTKDSILSGVINSIIFEIEGFISEYKSINKNLKLILSGGDSIFLAAKLKNRNFAEPNLLLYGLEEILFYNK